ncbi:MAG TPA: hypothetical protein VK077_05765 [Virgibacillus sp.]|nr:hypothetical protein [Virgibacillus sp.]
MSYLNQNELKLASRFLFLSMAMIVMKQDMRHIQDGAFKIKEPYIELLGKMLAHATDERRKLRQMMQRQKIQVIFLQKNDLFSSYLFLCNGREEKRNYFNPTIKKKVETIIDELMKKGLNQASDRNPNS